MAKGVRVAPRDDPETEKKRRKAIKDNVNWFLGNGDVMPWGMEDEWGC